MSEKLSSPLYFTYISLSILWNIKYLHVLFVDNHELYSAPKIEYVNKLYPFETNWFLHENPVLTELINGVLSFSWHFLPPAILTYIAVKYLPRVHAWAHNIYLTNYFERRKAWDKADLEYQQGLTKKVKQEAVEKVEQRNAKRVITRNQTPEEQWEIQFLTFATNPKNIQYLRNAVEAVYRTTGNVTTDPANAGSYRTYMEPDSISRLDTYDLITLNSDASRTWKIDFTPRGKYFVKRLQESNEK